MLNEHVPYSFLVFIPESFIFSIEMLYKGHVYKTIFYTVYFYLTLSHD